MSVCIANTPLLALPFLVLFRKEIIFWKYKQKKIQKTSKKLKKKKK